MAKKQEAVLKAKDNPTYQKIRSETDKLREALNVIMSQYREFVIPGADGDRTFRVFFPSPSVETAVNITYSRTYGKLLQDEDFMPEAQIVELMKKRGVWSDDKDEKIKQLRERQARVRSMIYLNGEENMTYDEMKKLTDEFEKLDSEIDELVEKRTGFMMNSIEARAQETKVKDQVWRCTSIIKDGKEEPYWKSLEEIDGERDRLLLYRIINECVSFWQGVPSNFLESLPEVLSGENATTSQEPQTASSSESQS